MGWNWTHPERTAARGEGDILTDDRWKKKVINSVAYNCSTKEIGLQSD